MKKNIWIMNHYATVMFDNQGGRHYNFSKYLKQNGYNPTIFCANVYHSNKSSIDINKGVFSTAEDENAKMVYVKTCESAGNGFKRVLNMAIFAKNLFFATKKYGKQINESPDIILASSVHPLTCIAGIFISKRYRVPCVVEIRDLWPESIVEYSSRFTKKNLLIKMLYQCEKWLYKKADSVIFTRPGDYEYIKDMKWNKEIPQSKCFYINNGVDLEVFDSNVNKYKITDVDLDSDDVFKIVYAGAIRTVNNLSIILGTAKKIVNPKIKFLIWGNGDHLEFLKKRVIDEKITNVIFKGHIQKQYIPYILSKADVNLATYSKTNMSRYGTSRNKNFEYMASSKPIISTEEDKYLFDETFAISFNYETEDDIVNAIVKMFGYSEEKMKKLGSAAREKSMEFDFKVLTEKLIEIINNV